MASDFLVEPVGRLAHDGGESLPLTSQSDHPPCAFACLLGGKAQGTQPQFPLIRSTSLVGQAFLRWTEAASGVVSTALW
jgi:hypothetical protein